MSVSWDAEARVLRGRSRVVQGDPYRVLLFVPEGFEPEKAEMVGREVALENTGGDQGWLYTWIGFKPETTTTVDWQVFYQEKGR